MTVHRKLSNSDPSEVGVDLITHVGCDDIEGGRNRVSFTHQLIGDTGSIVLIQGTLGASSRPSANRGPGRIPERGGSRYSDHCGAEFGSGPVQGNYSDAELLNTFWRG